MDSCFIKIADIFEFQWDTMYVFDDPYNFPEKYNKYRHLNFKEESYCPSLSITFVKDSRIVYEEFYKAKLIPPFDFEPYPIEFYTETIEYTPESAVFLVDKKEYDKRRWLFFYSKQDYLVLTPVDELDEIKQKQRNQFMKQDSLLKKEIEEMNLKMEKDSSIFRDTIRAFR
jgi:hypothetical protein